MKVPTQMIWLLLALLIVLIAGMPATASEVHVGKVVFAGEGKLVISDVDDTNEAFVVSETATITRNGKEANLSDLAEGDAVSVTATRKNGKLIAKTIFAATGR